MPIINNPLVNPSGNCLVSPAEFVDIIDMSNMNNDKFNNNNNEFVLPIIPNNIPEYNIFQAGIGCGDDLHLYDLIGNSGLPLFHHGYFYVPFDEYYLCGDKKEYPIQISGIEISGEQFGYICIDNVYLPDSDLHPILSIYSGDILAIGYYYDESSNLSYDKRNLLDTESMLDEFYNGVDPEPSPDPTPYKDSFIHHYPPTSWIKTYEPPTDEDETPMDSGLFRKVTDLTERRTYVIYPNESIHPYEFTLNEFEYTLNIDYSGDLAKLEFVFNSGHVGQNVNIEYEAGSFYTDHSHPLDPKYTPQFAGRFLTVTDEERSVEQVLVNSVQATQVLPNRTIDIITSVYDQFGGPFPFQDVTFRAVGFPGMLGEDFGTFVTLSGDFVSIDVTTIIDGTAKATYKAPNHVLTPRGVKIECSSGGKTGTLILHPGSTYRRKGQTYWFQCDLSKFDCRAARCAIGQGFFSNYSDGYDPISMPGSMDYDLSQWYYAFNPKEYTALPDLFQTFGADDHFTEESHSYINRTKMSAGEPTVTIHGIYSRPLRFGAGRAARQYTYVQAYHRPPIPYPNINDSLSGNWIFPDYISDWWDRKFDPMHLNPLKVATAENEGIWTVYDFLRKYKDLYPSSPTIDFDNFISECYVTDNGMWGQIIEYSSFAKNYIVYYVKPENYPITPLSPRIQRGISLTVFDDSILTIKELINESALWDRRSSTRRDTYATIPHL